MRHLYEALQSPTFKTQLLQSIQVNDFCFETFIKLCYPVKVYISYSFVVIIYSGRKAYLSLYFPLIFKATFSDMSQVMFSPLLWELDKFHCLLPTTNKHRPRSRITSNRLYACSLSVPCTVHNTVEPTRGGHLCCLEFCVVLVQYSMPYDV